MGHFQNLSLFFGCLQQIFGNRVFSNTQKLQLLLPHLTELLSSKEGPPVLLNDNGPLVFLIGSLVGSILGLISHFGERKPSHDTLSSSLQFLYNPNGCLQIGIQRNRISHHLSLLSHSQFPLDPLHNLIPGCRIIEILRKGDGECLGGKFEVDQHIIQVDVVSLRIGGVRAVSDDILLDLAHADDHIVQHLPHEGALLGVDHLVEGVLQVAVDLQVAQIQRAVVLEPLVVISLVGDALLPAVLLERVVLLLDVLEQFGDGALPLLVVVGCTHFEKNIGSNIQKQLYSISENHAIASELRYRAESFNSRAYSLAF